MTKYIFGFTGKMASGKDTAANYFIVKHGAERIKFSTPLRDMLDRMYLPHTRDNMQELSRILREQFGQDILANVIAQDAKSAAQPILVIDGVRRPADVKELKEHKGFRLIALDAPAEVRFERMKKRKENPDDAKKSWDQFRIDEKADAELLVPEIMKMADYTVDNSGDVASMHEQLEEIYIKITNGDKG